MYVKTLTNYVYFLILIKKIKKSSYKWPAPFKGRDDTASPEDRQRPFVILMYRYPESIVSGGHIKYWSYQYWKLLQYIFVRSVREFPLNLDIFCTAILYLPQIYALVIAYTLDRFLKFLKERVRAKLALRYSPEATYSSYFSFFFFFLSDAWNFLSSTKIYHSISLAVHCVTRRKLSYLFAICLVGQKSSGSNRKRRKTDNSGARDPTEKLHHCRNSCNAMRDIYERERLRVIWVYTCIVTMERHWSMVEKHARTNDRTYFLSVHFPNRFVDDSVVYMHTERILYTILQ